MRRVQVARLRGHYSQVLDLGWSEDGLHLCTVSEGAVYTWHMETFTRTQEEKSKTFFNSEFMDGLVHSTVSV